MEEPPSGPSEASIEKSRRFIESYIPDFGEEDKDTYLTHYEAFQKEAAKLSRSELYALIYVAEQMRTIRLAMDTNDFALLRATDRLDDLSEWLEREVKKR